uniref:ABC transmembrane type-1 domain-containing protein n=1 Tax=Elaeophora elaphi TaxID=1147741 RepID=A0A0R3RNP2_9BILA
MVSARNIYLSYFVEHTGKQDNFYEICLPLYSSLILFSISVLWALYSPGKIIERDPRLYLYTMGTVFSNIAVRKFDKFNIRAFVQKCRLIIAQMCNTRAEIFNLCLAMYSAVAIASLSGFLSTYQELLFLRLAVTFITLAHLHFGICVVRQLCEHFKIYAFSLHYLQQPLKHYDK